MMTHFDPLKPGDGQKIDVLKTKMADGRVVNSGNLIFLEISGKLSKAWEVITSIIFIRISRYSSGRAKNKLFLLNSMHIKVKA